MPSDWNLFRFPEKGRPQDMCKYRVISLLPIAYKVLPYKRIVWKIEAPRQGKFTIDQIMEKWRDNQDKTQHLFVGFKAAFNSPVRDRVYATMSKLGIPA